jgi:hypothetical protein
MTYATELARLFKRRPVEFQRAIASLERAGVVATRRVGRVRIVQMEPRFPESAELYTFLLRTSERPNYASRWTAVRRRPRAMGKAL